MPEIQYGSKIYGKNIGHRQGRQGRERSGDKDPTFSASGHVANPLEGIVQRFDMSSGSAIDVRNPCTQKHTHTH